MSGGWLRCGWRVVEKAALGELDDEYWAASQRQSQRID
jgi:hypothetical protein